MTKLIKQITRILISVFPGLIFVSDLQTEKYKCGLVNITFIIKRLVVSFGANCKGSSIST